MNLEQELDERQLEAVTTDSRCTLVLAAAGSGKTRVLTYRVAYLIENGVNPRNIMAVTFTNKAADEMKERIENLAGSEAAGIWAGTFHSMCARILRRHWSEERDFTIIDDAAQRRIILDIIRHMDIEKDHKPSTVASKISLYKSNLISPAECAKQANDKYEQSLAAIYQEYDDYCRRINVLDFDDLIMRVIDLFRDRPEILAYYQKRFAHILVDEYQDVNMAQYEFVRLIVGEEGSVFATGDDFQCLYSWRGADISHILNFEQDYPNVRFITMDQSYRCTKNIVAAANKVIAQNVDQYAKDLWSDRENGVLISIRHAHNEYDEAEGTRRKIVDLLRNGCDYQDIAVLYRTRMQSEPVENELNHARVPCVVLSSTKFYDRMEVKDIAAYLSVIFSLDDDTALGRIINIPRRGIGNVTVNKLKALARKKKVTLYQAMHMRDETDIGSHVSEKIGEFLELIDRMKVQADSTPLELINIILNSTVYDIHLERFHDISARMANIEQLKSIANRYTELEDFLDRFRLATDAEIPNADKNAVKLMTCHAAKGLEFKAVFVVGVEDELFPHKNASCQAQIEEERRLFYVAITRAKDELYLSHTSMRTRGKTVRTATPSRFLKDIPRELTSSGWRGG